MNQKRKTKSALGRPPETENATRLSIYLSQAHKDWLGSKARELGGISRSKVVAWLLNEMIRQDGAARFVQEKSGLTPEARMKLADTISAFLKSESPEARALIGRIRESHEESKAKP